MGEHLVIATDGGNSSRSAMDWTIDYARSRPVDVELVTVEELDWLPVGADEEDYRDKYTGALESGTAYLAHHKGIEEVTPALLVGDPADSIADAAASAEHLVIGSPRRSDAAGPLHGTLALRIAARVPTRMTVVPLGWEPRGGAIVVGSDDETSGLAVDYAVDEARRLHCDLLIVHSWMVPTPFVLVQGLLPTEYPTLEALHRERLERVVMHAKARQPAVTVRHLLKYGRPAEVLAHAAKAEGRLIIGTHRRGRLGAIFLGSAGHDLLMAAPAPVTIVPSAPTGA